MWIIERDVFPAEEEERLRSVLIDRSIDHAAFSGSAIRTQLPAVEADTILRGSCWLFQQLERQASWRSDLWGCETAFDYTNYAPRYSSFLLNHPFHSLSFHELCWKREEFLPHAASAIFVRPDTGMKSIDGQLVTHGGFDAWMKGCQLLQLPGSARLIVAEPRKIEEEYRCIVVDGAMIAGSRYRPTRCEGCPQGVREFVHRIATEVTPPSRAYAIDIAVTQAGLSIIEIGCVCCVAFYQADSEAIVTHFSRLAQE